MVIDVDSTQLAPIAVNSAATYRKRIGDDAKVALVSFSVNNSVAHQTVSKVSAAVNLARRQDPSWTVDSEIQFDTAFVAPVSSAEFPTSYLKGEANIFIFPGLDGASIGYKIAQRIGGATVIGPGSAGSFKAHKRSVARMSSR